MTGHCPGCHCVAGDMVLGHFWTMTCRSVDLAELLDIGGGS